MSSGVRGLQEGFARLAASRYTLDPTQLSNIKVHLTNASLQGDDDTSALPEPLQPAKGHANGHTKISLTRLWTLLAEQGIERQQLWPAICDTVLAALCSAQDAIPHQVGRTPFCPALVLCAAISIRSTCARLLLTTTATR